MLAAPCPGEVGEFEEFPPCMRPAEGFGHGTAGPCGRVEAGKAAVGIGLEDSGIAGQVPFGMLAAAVARIVEEHCRLALAERSVVADIGPEPAGDRLALGEHRHGRVVAVQPLGGEHMGADQLVERRQGGRHRRRHGRPSSRGRDRRLPGHSARSAG